MVVAVRLIRPGRLVAAVLAVMVAGGSFLALSRLSDDAGALTGPPARAETGTGLVQSLAGPLSSEAPIAAPGTRAFAQVGGLTLHLPARRPGGIAYHEASRARAVMLTPLGRCVRNENRTKFQRPPPTPGPRYVVMSSRGRGRPATSAVDVAMTTGAKVLSPITGTVSRVKRYRLYGVYRDFRLSLQPAGQAELRTIVLHVSDLRVRPGSVVVAGVTELGSVRSFPFRSQVNDYFGRGTPHVHVEVQRVGA